MIYTFGDSHALFGWKNTINRNNINSILCYTFGKNPLGRFNIKDYNVQDGDTVIFCMGEVDCRFHVHKHISEAVSYRQIIDDIVDLYFKAIKINVEQSQKRLKVCVYNVVPPVHKEGRPFSPEVPYLGTDEERREYTLYFNGKIAEKCTEYNYVFFDVYNKYADEDGFLNDELSDGIVHIANGVFIDQFLDTL